MFREGFTTPDNVQKKDLFFNDVTRSSKKKEVDKKKLDIIFKNG